MNETALKTSQPGGTVLLGPLFGELLGYPGPGYFDKVQKAVEKLSVDFPVPGKQVREFERAIRSFDLGSLEEHYSKTFDLAPECVPYVGVHAFGEHENRRRWFLCGLSDRYREAGFEPGTGELPDHIAILMNALPLFTAEEHRDLVSNCLLGAARKMAQTLNKTESPYALLMEAVVSYLESEPLENAL